MIPQDRMAVNGQQRLERGAEFESRAADELRLHGLRIDKFGQALLSPEVREVLKRTYSLLRWLPDLVGWRPSRPNPFLIDAKSCLRSTANHAIELRVLLAAQFTDLPVFFICDDYKTLPSNTVWPDGCISRPCCDSCLAKAHQDPTGRVLPTRCPEHIARNGRGSGTPYVLVERKQCRPLGEFFGPRRCLTCNEPELNWDAMHPLYRTGAGQCPLCMDADSPPWPEVAKPGGGIPKGVGR